MSAAGDVPVTGGRVLDVYRLGQGDVETRLTLDGEVWAADPWAYLAGIPN